MTDYIIQYKGEAFALITAFCWAFNTLFYSLGGKRVGSYTVNVIRLYIAFPAILIIHLISEKTLFPLSASGSEYFWLSISGIIGFVLGDACLYEALVLLGARLTMLIMTLTPIFSAFIGWLFLNEILSLTEISAIVITVFGIAWVVSHEKYTDKKRKKENLWGILFAVGGALGQALGLLFSKIGMEKGISTISANSVRIAAALILMIIITSIRGKIKEGISKMKDLRSFKFILLGTILGPVIGVILSLYAINNTELGIASTLMALSPIILIPVHHFLFNERITLHSVLGTITALVGVSVLFLN